MTKKKKTELLDTPSSRFNAQLAKIAKKLNRKQRFAPESSKVVKKTNGELLYDIAIAEAIKRNRSHRVSNISAFEVAPTVSGIPKDFVNISLFDFKVTIVIGTVTPVKNCYLDVYWDAAGKCFNSTTQLRYYPGDLML